MPEGDTVFQTARRQHAALAGKTLTGFDLRVPEFAASDLNGEVVHEVVSVGKHLFHRIGAYSLHSHLKMEGSWRLFRSGERWTRPAHLARAVLDTATVTAVGFELGVTELIRTADEHTVVGHLGPDLLGPGWDAAGASHRLAAAPDVPVFVAVLDQRNLAGIGNVYANELCFLRGLDPARPRARWTACRPWSTSRGGCWSRTAIARPATPPATCVAVARPGSTAGRASPAGAAGRP